MKYKEIWEKEHLSNIQLRKDITDLMNFNSVSRCKCCTHLVNDGWVCLNCGCDNSYMDEYTENDILLMRAKR